MNNVRLIDANELKKCIANLVTEERYATSKAQTMNYAYEDAMGAIDSSPSVAQAMRWISVKDKLPEQSDSVLAWVVENGYEIEDGRVELCDYDSAGFWTSYEGYPLQYEPNSGLLNKEDVYTYITHWMPLPERPEEAPNDELDL